MIGLYFGGFQALMPLIGWALGIQFRQYITAVDHWVAFILLGIIGGKMVLKPSKAGKRKTSWKSVISHWIIRNVYTCHCDQHRCAGRWNYFCISKDTNRGSDHHYRNRYPGDLRGWCCDRKLLWKQVQKQSRAGRWGDLSLSWLKDSFGTSGDLWLKETTIPSFPFGSCANVPVHQLHPSDHGCGMCRLLLLFHNTTFYNQASEVSFAYLRSAP